MSRRRSQRSASSITWLETINAAPRRRARRRCPTTGGAAPGRGRPWARRAPAHPACVSKATASDTRERWPPDSCPASESLPIRRVRRPRRRSIAVVLRRRAPTQRSAGSRDGEIGVDARRLGHVADPAAQRRAARGLAEHGDRPALDDLDADDAAHQRRLATPDGPSSPVICPRATRVDRSGMTSCPPRTTSEVDSIDLHARSAVAISSNTVKKSGACRACSAAITVRTGPATRSTRPLQQRACTERGAGASRSSEAGERERLRQVSRRVARRGCTLRVLISSTTRPRNPRTARSSSSSAHGWLPRPGTRCSSLAEPVPSVMCTCRSRDPARRSSGSGRCPTSTCATGRG